MASEVRGKLLLAFGSLAVEDDVGRPFSPSFRGATSTSPGTSTPCLVPLGRFGEGAKRLADGPLVLLREQLLPHLLERGLVILDVGGSDTTHLCPFLEEATDCWQRRVVWLWSGRWSFRARLGAPMAGGT